MRDMQSSTGSACAAWSPTKDYASGSLRGRWPASIALTVALVLLLLGSAQPAFAVSVGSEPSWNEAPWAVRLSLGRGSRSHRCSGEIVRPGLILTSAHCFNMFSECSGIPPTRTYMKFAYNKVLKIGSDTPTRLHRHPQYGCAPGSANFDTNDVGFIRYYTNMKLPAVPLASPEEIASFANRGVTLFGAGRCCRVPSGYTWPTWTRKSVDGGLFQKADCSVPGQLCFDPRRSSVLPGDSGGAFVGWVGTWKLLGVASGYWYDGKRITFNTAASLADPAIRSWVDQQIATL